MKVKSLVSLLLTVLLTVCCSWLAIKGSPEVGKYSLKPFGSAISLGLDLRGGMYTVYQAKNENVDPKDMQSAMATLRKRLDAQGYTEATVVMQGAARIRIEIPDVSDPDQVMSIIGKPAKLEFVGPDGVVIMDGSAIKTAEPQVVSGKGNIPVVAFTLNDSGRDAFAVATTKFVNQKISITLDGEVISSPTVNSPIPNGEGSIEGMESAQAANELAMLIQSGAITVDLEQLEMRTVSATLGVDALSSAVLAGAIGIACVMVFMLVYYRLPGLAATIALAIYTLLMFLIMILMHIQLTLPGIAGIVLSIGMAVDANVIIFERFREELRSGKSLKASLESGFKRAFTAIFDSNITTLIAAFVLMYFGTGPIKGFAYTLALGVALSMFTAIVVTRFLLRRVLGLGIKRKSIYAPVSKEVAAS